MPAVAVFEQSRYPHYISPAASAVIAVAAQSARVVAGARLRPDLVRFVLLAALAAIPARAILGENRYLHWNRYLSWCCPAPGNVQRAAVEDRLRASGGRHLVIVRYGPSHHWMDEWVYNRAVIDDAPVVWARDMGEAGNRDLLRYFAGRKVWLVEPEGAVLIRPYP